MAAAVDAQRAFAVEAWANDVAIRVRMGIHLGEGRLRARLAAGDAEDYVGSDVNYAARIAAAANGGQIVLPAPLVAALPAIDDVVAAVAALPPAGPPLPA